MAALAVVVYAAVLTIGIYAWVVIGGGLAGLAVVLVVGCTVVPAATAHRACELMSTALDEADMAEAWYIEAGQILQACGARDAMARSAIKACYARRKNDDREVCQ